MGTFVKSTIRLSTKPPLDVQAPLGSCNPVPEGSRDLKKAIFRATRKLICANWSAFLMAWVKPIRPCSFFQWMLESTPESTEPAPGVIARSYNNYEILQVVWQRRWCGDSFFGAMGGQGCGPVPRTNSRFDVESIDVRMNTRGEGTRRPLTIV
jgi:hypothetical protein